MTSLFDSLARQALDHRSEITSPVWKMAKGATAKKLARQRSVRDHVAKDRAAKAWLPPNRSIHAHS